MLCIRFDITCNVSLETMCMLHVCQALFSGKKNLHAMSSLIHWENKKTILKCCLLLFDPKNTKQNCSRQQYLDVSLLVLFFKENKTELLLVTRQMTFIHQDL